MAQNGPHDHQAAAASDERIFTPPTTMTFLGPAENRNGGSRIGSPVGMDASKGKDVVLPNAVQGGEHGSAGGGEANADKSKGKHPAVGDAATAAAGDGFPKGKGSLAADDGGDTKAHIITERERRKRMKDLFSNLHALMPHVPEKVRLSHDNTHPSCEARMRWLARAWSLQMQGSLTGPGQGQVISWFYVVVV
jgi:hypothetical protein